MGSLQHVSAGALEEMLPFGKLIPALEAELCRRVECPRRSHVQLHEKREQDDRAELVTMPAWDDEWIGVKLLTAFPGNAQQNMPTLNGLMVLFEAVHGTPVMTIDGAELTLRRTAAVSAIASRHLARADSKTLLMIGAGRQLPAHLEAQCHVRDIARVLIWARDPARARAAVERLPDALSKKLDIQVVPKLEKAVKEADIICTSVHSTVPILSGAWVRHGTHVDATGAYRPDMREIDNALLARAAIYVDTLEGALSEDGDILDALKKGAIEPDAIRGGLADLLQCGAKARTVESDITLFKAVGAGFEDLAVARLAQKESMR